MLRLAYCGTFLDCNHVSFFSSHFCFRGVCGVAREREKEGEVYTVLSILSNMAMFFMMKTRRHTNCIALQVRRKEK